LEETLRFDSPRFVVDPDVNWEWDRVAFEAVGGEEDHNEAGDLQPLAFKLGEFLPTSADDYFVPEGLGELGEGEEERGVRGPGLVEVDGDGEGVH